MAYYIVVGLLRLVPGQLCVCFGVRINTSFVNKRVGLPLSCSYLLFLLMMKTCPKWDQVSSMKHPIVNMVIPFQISKGP